MSKIKWTLPMLFAVWCSSACNSCKSTGCGNDNDCKGERFCSDGRCQDPENQGSTATVCPECPECPACPKCDNDSEAECEYINFTGDIDSRERFKSGWIDNISPAMTLPAGTKIRFHIGGSAEKVALRLASATDDRDTRAGYIGTPTEVPADRTVEITLDSTYKNINHISVHGGPEPWPGVKLGERNGAATLNSASYCLKKR